MDAASATETMDSVSIPIRAFFFSESYFECQVATLTPKRKRKKNVKSRNSKTKIITIKYLLATERDCHAHAIRLSKQVSITKQQTKHEHSVYSLKNQISHTQDWLEIIQD